MNEEIPNVIAAHDYEFEYPNYRTERKNREVAFYDSRERGTLRYQRIPMSGHKFVPQREPRHRNCEADWFVFFQVHGEFTQAIEELYQKNPAILRTIKGPKFVKNFLKFMSTVAAFQSAVGAKQPQEQDEYSVGSVEGSNEGEQTDDFDGKIDSIRVGNSN